MTEPSATIWPRMYLLQIYKQAVDNGHVVLHPISEKKAESLKMSLYRLRRRSDTSNAIFIAPEYHLVTVGRWTPAAGGTLHILYSSMPDETLPTIQPFEGEDGLTYVDPTPRHTIPSNHLRDATEELISDVSEIDLDTLMTNLRAGAAKRSEEG